MLNKNSIKYSYNDISIVPHVISSISSRSECNPFDESGYLPIFTAPMTNVVDLDSVEEFEKNKIHTVIPRSIDIDSRLDYARNTKRWIAVSLKEFEENFIEFKEENIGLKVLIDIANGHMSKLYDTVKTSKEIYGKNLTIMIGNIANPETYRYAISSGADFVRCSIGSGQGCLTSSNTAIHYPIVSLIDEIRKIKESYAAARGMSTSALPKIVADGGIRNYSDVIKALAVGADCVMVGGLLSSLLGSAGEMRDIDAVFEEVLNKEDIIYKEGKFFCKGKEVNLHKLFYGMASKKGQEDFNAEKKKTSEGCVKWIKMTHTIQGWAENMEAYLKSAMSYTSSKVLNDLRKAEVIVVSQATLNSVNK